jgi:hypothetical protein
MLKKIEQERMVLVGLIFFVTMPHLVGLFSFLLF